MVFIGQVENQKLRNYLYRNEEDSRIFILHIMIIPKKTQESLLSKNPDLYFHDLLSKQETRLQIRDILSTFANYLS